MKTATETGGSLRETPRWPSPPGSAPGGNMPAFSADESPELAALDQAIRYLDTPRWNAGFIQTFLANACMALQADRMRMLEFFPGEMRVSRVCYWNGPSLPPGIQDVFKRSARFWERHLSVFSPDGFYASPPPAASDVGRPAGGFASLQHIMESPAGTRSLLILDDHRTGRRFTNAEKERVIHIHRIIRRWLIWGHRVVENPHVMSVDPLTHVMTRYSFCTQMEQNLRRQPERPFALINLGINHLAAINCLIGHDETDRVLAQFAHTVMAGLHDGECIGREDAGIFWVLVNYTGRYNLERRLNTWKRKFARQASFNGSPLNLSLAIGVCLMSECERNHPSGGMEKAAFARKISKTLPPGTVRYYDRQLHQLKINEEDMDIHVMSSLSAHRFLIYLQPKYRLCSGQMTGAEALVRWQHPTRGFLMPGDFIPLFERNHFILILDFYVLEEVCRLIQKWHNTGMPVVPIAVNFSRLHAQTADFVPRVLEITRRYGVLPSELEIEMTESAFVGDQDNLAHAAVELKRMGFSIAMDDFGLGYSSLNSLEGLPVDILKLDRRFLAPRKSMGRAMVIVREVIRMAKRLNLFVVSEGVEYPWQADFLRGTGCDVVQGFLYSRPVPVNNFERMLERLAKTSGL